jgi:hypothetical protein
MTDIFFSYCSENSFVADLMIQRLVSNKVTTWFDKYDMRGQHAKAGVMAGLIECQEVVALVTHQSLKSEWMRWELAAAEALGKPVTLAIDGPSTKRLPELWQDFVRIKLNNFDELTMRIAKRTAVRPPRDC